MSYSPKLTRRSVLAGGAVAAVGLVVGFRFSSLGRGRASGTSAAALFQPNAYLRIASDSRVTAIMAPSEMGQGIYTALAMILADELDAAWQDIAVEPAPVDAAYGNPFFQGIQATAASTSVAVFYDTTREAAAAARMMLVTAAASRWGIAASDCTSSDSAVLGPAGQRASYGELVAEASQLKPPAKAALQLKNPKDFKLIGRSMPRLETRQIVTGGLVYGMDIDVPGTLTAVVARAPSAKARLRGYQRASALEIPGVRAIVEIPSGVAVIADHYWAARSARAALQTEWDVDRDTAFASEDLERQFRALAGTAGPTAFAVGEEHAGKKGLVSAEYSVPYLAHAPMEPLNCTIRATGHECDVWVGTQYQSLDRKRVAEILGLPEPSVRINTLHMGGGFGRRGSPDEDVVAETANIVKAARTLPGSLGAAPIKNVWAREDDIRGGFYRPMAVNLLQATLDPTGLPSTWVHRIVAQSPMRRTEFEFLVTRGIDETSVAGAKDLPYAIPNRRIDLHTPEAGPTVQWMRSVGNSNTCFAIECFLDELAYSARQDPVDYRRKLLAGKKENERLLNVLNIAADKAGWGSALLPGHGRGIAVQDFWGTKVAQIAEVLVHGDTVHVERVVCVMDCGLVVNPDGVRAQIEGGIIYGLSAALYGAITFKEGRAQQSNFDDYPVVRMSACPSIEVHLVPSAEPPGGVGEAAVPHIAPAVCNAVFAASGRRIRALPLAVSGFKA